MRHSNKEKLKNEVTIFGKKFNTSNLILDFKITILFIFILLSVLLLLYFQLTEYYQIIQENGLN